MTDKSVMGQSGRGKGFSPLDANPCAFALLGSFGLSKPSVKTSQGLLGLVWSSWQTPWLRENSSASALFELLVDCTPKDYEWKRTSPTLFFWEQTSSKTGSFIFPNVFLGVKNLSKNLWKPPQLGAIRMNDAEKLTQRSRRAAEAVPWPGPNLSLSSRPFIINGAQVFIFSGSSVYSIPQLGVAFSTIQKQTTPPTNVPFETSG